MNRLKTLNELATENDFKCAWCGNNLTVGFDVDYIELKHEAIKWIKESQNEIKKGRGEFIRFCEEYGDYVDGIKWIKHFFNITEEDLK